MIDALIGSVRNQRADCDANAANKGVVTPEGSADKAAENRLERADALWMKQHRDSPFRDRNHVNDDARYKLSRHYSVADVATHDIVSSTTYRMNTARIRKYGRTDAQLHQSGSAEPNPWRAASRPVIGGTQAPRNAPAPAKAPQPMRPRLPRAKQIHRRQGDSQHREHLRTARTKLNNLTQKFSPLTEAGSLLREQQSLFIRCRTNNTLHFDLCCGLGTGLLKYGAFS